MKRNYLLTVGSPRELREMSRRIHLPKSWQIRGILLCEEQEINPAEPGTGKEERSVRFSLPWEEPPEIYEALNQVKGRKGFDLVLDLGGRLGDGREVFLDSIPFFIGPDRLEWFYQSMEYLSGLEYRSRLLDILTTYATEGIQIADAAGNYIYCNDASYRISGVAREEREGRNVFEVQQDGSLSRVLSTQQPVYAHLSYPAPGHLSIANASPIYNEKQEIEGAVCIFNDASNAYRFSKALEEKKREIASLRKELSELNRPVYGLGDLVGTSPAFQICLNQARQAALRQATVLITGESGTGKELFAHSIHRLGNRSGRPFIKVNCPAIPANLLESELFGHERGAFTGAAQEKPGKFELAEGGSIFLDEIGDLELLLQAKLLRVLQEHEVERLGATKVKKVDVRVIAATNRDLLEQVAQGLFRKDLYYRLDVIHIHIPPLRERREDIPVLMEYLLKKHGGGIARRVQREAMELLNRYSWPGNVREMENLVTKLLMFQDKGVITKEDVAYMLRDPAADPKEEQEELNLAELEKQAILKALKRYGSSLAGKREAASALGISLSSLYDRLKKFRLQG